MGLDTSFLSGGLSSIQSAVHGALDALVAQWGSDTRLYTLSSPSGEQPLPADLMVESFVLHEAVSQPFSLYIHALVLHAQVELKQLYARPITLQTTLADGSRACRSGYVVQAEALEADGGFARKGLLVQPWIALLGHTLNSRIWQDKSVIEIVEDVFADHASVAAWRWDEGVANRVAQGLFARNGGQRAYCVQYRETDLDFVSRLLVEEGLCYRLEEDASAPGGHAVVIFASSGDQPQDATSASSLGGLGIRFHRSSSQEAQDSIQALGAMRAVGSTATAVQGWDYAANRAITAEVPTSHQWGGDEARDLQRWLSSYDPTGGYLFGNQAEAQFTATCLQEAHEARYKTWLGRGTVRTLRAGTWMTVTQSTLDPLSALGSPDSDKAFFVYAVSAYGVNNLPKDMSEAIVESLGQAELPELSVSVDQVSVDMQALRRQAAQTGFACQFQALRREVPWRAALPDGTGLRPRPRATALGTQTAIVVGPHGDTSAQGADELYTDKLGRVKVKFHWQANACAPQRGNSDHSCWVRVMQRLSGPGMGHQFIPRIGQEVLVGFLNNDMDRPCVINSLYNGRGEGGVPRTPGGQAAESDTSAFAESTDHSTSAQMNLIASGSGGNSPAWHGAAPGVSIEGQAGQNNAAALSGVKSKEFGGAGYNQLVFDDTPGQGRLKLHTTQAQTWLQMGQLLHQADNHRGSFRGLGFELRTDAWGGVRAARGVMLSTYSLNNGLGQTAEGAGDNAAGIALARQMQQLASTFDQAARTHQAVGLASAAGTTAGNQSALDESLAPAAALTRSLGGMVSQEAMADALGDAFARNTSTGEGKVPHMLDANIALVGKAGVGVTAGQDLHLSSQDAASIASGQDMHWAVGGQARIHTGQAIGLLAGTIQPGGEAAGKGLTLIAAQGAVDMQAQAGAAQLASQQALELKSANGVANIAAARRIVLAVAGGAGITIEQGQLTVQCPGKILVQAGMKSMAGPGSMSWVMPGLPRSSLPDDVPAKFNMLLTHVPGPNGKPLPNVNWHIVRAADARLALRADKALLSGQSNAQGKVDLGEDRAKALQKAYNQHPNELWLVYAGQVRSLILERAQPGWSDLQKRQAALDAMGYTDELGSVNNMAPDDTGHTRAARRDIGSVAGARLINHLQKG